MRYNYAWQTPKGNTMSKSAMVRARLEPDLKEHAEDVFQKLGLSVTQAITLFYKQVELQNGLPFKVGLPNKLTQETFDKTDAGKELNTSKNIDDMFGKLGL